MTDTASPHAAPAHDSANLQQAQPQPETASESLNQHYAPQPQPAVSSRNTRDLFEDSSDSELSSLPSDTDELLEEIAEPTASAAENATNGEATEDIEQRPSKRRRVQDGTPPPSPPHSKRKIVESPPWKKFEADGPTTYIENGLRKSGRLHKADMPLELQPRGSQRMTRGSLHDLRNPQTSKDRHTSTPKQNGHINGYHKSASAGRGIVSRTPASTAKSSSKKPLTNGSKVNHKTTTRKRSVSPVSKASPRRTSTRTRHSSRHDKESLDTPARDLRQTTQTSPTAHPTRIRLRLRPPTIPLVHPAQVNVPPGHTIARPKLGEDFADFLLRAPSIDIKDGGWQDSEDGPPYTEEQAEKDARIVLRAEDEFQPEGMLSEQKCSVFVPEAAEEPPRQWAHMDHLLKAMANFRRLMQIEKQRHRSEARRLAYLCRDEWLRRQPKSAEEIEAEKRAAWLVRYKTVVKALGGTWENVKTEINRHRLEEWEAAEQKRVKAALNEAVSMSELKLQARRAHFDSEQVSDEDEDSEDEASGEDDEDDENESTPSDGEALSGNESDEDEDESNMSSTDDDEDAKSDASDAGLTQEQLRQKYANIPDLTPDEATGIENGEGTEPEADATSTQGGETSDESIDMDDDLSSSDEDMESEEADDESGEEEEDDQPGLLGMLFGKSELKKMREEASGAAETPKRQGDVEMANALTATNGDTIATADGVDTSENASPTLPAVNGLTTSGQDALYATGASTASPPRPVSPPKNPHQPNKPDAAATVPGPLIPKDIQEEISEVVEQTKKESSPKLANVQLKKDITAGPKVEVEIEVATAPGTVNTSPATDAIAGSLSHDDSHSPHTTDTKPSDIDVVSLAAESGASRSASPGPGVQAPKTEVPFLLRGTLREYQHYGLDWLAGLYQNKTNGILADEMGLGKTIQTIALLAHLACHHEVWGPHLVIVPTSVMLNWEMEFKKWCPGFKVLSYYGSIEERKRKRHGWKTNDMWNVCITSYQIVLQDQQVFKRRQWHYMILDEAHNIKNFKSKRWQTLLTFNTQARLLLTGTPLQNNLTELWSLLFFLMPSENGVGGFADLAEFQDWFHKPESQILESGREQLDEEARAIIAKLHKVLRPYLLRRLKADVEKQMPAKYEHVEFCRLSRRQRELYDGFLARTDTREALASGNYISVINCLMQLRKVCNHPDLFVERPIMTSFRQRSSVVADYASTDSLIKTKLLAEKPLSVVNLDFLNLVPTAHEGLSSIVCERVSQLSSKPQLMALREVQLRRAQAANSDLDPVTVESNITFIEKRARWDRFEELQHCVYLNALRQQQRPILGKNLRDLLTIGTDERPRKPRPRVPAKIMAWFEEESPILQAMVLDVDQRAAAMKTIISKFACITPAVVTRDMDRFVLGSRGVSGFNETNLRLSAPVRYAPFMPKEATPDPWHEARMRLSIQFPDKRLLQYDCGKLQVLDRLLRKLQAGGHRALIFTQMTKVLDILEQFLNIHGHKYLRLDGATKVEQRQILTDRFNHDPRILAFILSTRSGGLGINLTGADTVIFYDQDWNPAMDKQCQDRCHRIGQTRDVHIYRLVSEHTIEANILRKASQKQMLDDVVIQEGGFTTDYFNKLSVQDVMKGVGDDAESDMVGDAMDRVLGRAEPGGDRAVGRVLEQAEDTEDVTAARVAEKEIHEDEADFDEKAPTTSASGASSTRQGTPVTRDASAAPGAGRSNLGLYGESADQAEVELNALGQRMHNIDDFMLSTMARMLEGTPLELPKDKKKSRSKKGRDHRKR